MRSSTPLGSGIRSLLVPGWGQMRCGFPRTGRLLVLVTGLAAVLALALAMFLDPMTLLAALARPEILLTLVIFNLAYLTLRIGAATHAFMSAEGRRYHLAMLAAAVIVAAPHLVAGWVGWETYTAVTSIFPIAAPATDLAPNDTAVLPSLPIVTPPERVALSPIVTVPGQDDAELAQIQPSAPWQPLGTERINILLLGGDAGPGRGGLRTDTMILVSLNPVSGDTAMIGVPRNYSGFEFTDGTPFPGRRLNHVYGWGLKNPEGFTGPNPGASATMNAVESILGLEVDHYALVDLTGFARLVDAFGGVDLDVVAPVDGPLYDPETGEYEMVTIQAGSQRLDGAHALAFARARYGSSDYARMARQRCILTSMLREADFLGLLARYGALLTVLEETIETDLPYDLLPDMIQLLPRMDIDSIRTLGLDATWALGRTADGHPIPDTERIRSAVSGLISGQEDVGDSGAVKLAAGCG